MITCSDLADWEWLTGSEAGAILKELAADETPLHSAVARLRGRFTQNRTHLLIEQAELRRRAQAKFSQAQRMFFTRIGLEQATDEWVARYKAKRFLGERAGLLGTPRGEASPPPIFADLCCGIGGDLMALSERSTVIGVDCDPITAHFAAENSAIIVHPINASDFDFKDIAAWHIDPDRRPAGRRTVSLEWCEPDRTVIEHLLAQVPHAAVKLAPACEVPAEWAARCELEWISRDRECRQLVAWHGELAIAPGLHRATMLSAACGLASRTIIGQPQQPIQVIEKVDRYIFDIDPAVLAAQLKGALAAEQELSALSDGPTYLTGPQAVADAALSCFEVEDVLPYRVSQLSQHLRARGIGQLEIKKRGLAIEPEQLRRKLNLRGDKAASLLITHSAGRPTAILARRVHA